MIVPTVCRAEHSDVTAQSLMILTHFHIVNTLPLFIPRILPRVLVNVLLIEVSVCE